MRQPKPKRFFGRMGINLPSFALATILGLSLQVTENSIAASVVNQYRGKRIR